MKKYPALIVLWFLLIGGPVHGRTSVEAELAKDTAALFPVIIAENSSVRVKDAAAELATYLGRISGAKFETRSGDGTKGIAVGLPGDFPSLGLAETLAVGTAADREAYILRSHRNGLYVVGATAPAVEHAVWDLLYRLGCRQFFPGETWEVIPRNDNIKIAIDLKERPDYLARRIWYGFGTWDYNAKPYAEWCRRNRATSGFVLQTSHAYDSIIRRNQAVFDEHPEYLGLLDGERKSSKLCIGNPGLRKLVADRAVAYFADNPDADSISMDPSDGGDRTSVEWPPDVPMTIISSLDEPAALSGSWNLCFYVPRGTKIVGLYADGGGTLLDASGKVVFTFTGKKAKFHKITVPKGADAAIWRFRNSTGTKRLMTVPPCLTPSPQQLLLPRETVNADSARQGLGL